MKPVIDIVMVAWPRSPARLKYMRETLESITRCVTAADHDLRIYVSAEMVDVTAGYFQAAREICAANSAELHWRAKQPSLGGNMNDALMLGYGQYKLLTQDDWPWQSPHNVSRDADFLDQKPEYAMVRYATFYTEFEADGVTVKMNGPYPYGDQPHLRRADFATRESATGGKPVGFYRYANFIDGPANYATPENEMSEHLRAAGWKIAAYRLNLVSHNGTLSADPARHPVGV